MVDVVIPAATPIPVRAIGDEAIAVEKAIMAAPAGTEPKWAKPILSLVILAMLAGTMAYAAIIKDHDMVMLCWGVLTALMSAVTHYYLGSSSQSERLLAAAPPVATVTKAK